jgi:ABC-type proline/glycine betaine transport system permease subunit
MIPVCFVINIFLTLLFIATAIVWEQQQNRTAAVVCTTTGITLIISVPSLVYLLLKHRLRLLKNTVEE